MTYRKVKDINDKKSTDIYLIINSPFFIRKKLHKLENKINYNVFIFYIRHVNFILFDHRNLRPSLYLKSENIFQALTTRGLTITLRVKSSFTNLI